MKLIHNISLFLILFIGVSILSAPLFAWQLQNGVVVCTAVNTQDLPEIASDSQGGAIVVWQDSRFTSDTPSSSYDIYAQRINKFGNPVWQINGIGIATGTLYQSYPKVISDNNEGAIIAWYDNYQVSAQRINSIGSTLWTSNGVSVMTTRAYPYILNLVSDGKHGTIIVWMDSIYENYYYGYNIRAQHINQNGQLLWGANGVAICTANYQQVYPDIVSDGVGGAIICWADYRDLNGVSGKVYVQRVNSQGSTLWTPDGIPLFSKFPYIYDFDYFPSIVSDNQGGAIVTWGDTRSSNGSEGVYAQRVNSVGSTLWGDYSLPIQTPYSAVEIGIVSDGENGAIIGWSNNKFLQKVNGSGVLQWDSSGIWTSTTYNYQDESKMTQDNLGGVIITWKESDQIYAQNVNKDGSRLWGEKGVSICSTSKDKRHIRITPDDLGGAIITWRDSRNGNFDIYAQRTDATGSILSPSIPQDLVALPISNTQIKLTWKDIANDENGFGIDVKTGNGNWQVLNFVSSNITTYAHSGLLTGQSYCYRVYSYNTSRNSGYSNEVCAIPGTPLFPTNLSIMSTTNNEIVLNWKDNSNNESGFGIDRKIGSTSWEALTFIGPNETTYSQVNLTNGFTYSYRVYGWNSYGLSSYSNEASITINPAPTSIPKQLWELFGE